MELWIPNNSDFNSWVTRGWLHIEAVLRLKRIIRILILTRHEVALNEFWCTISVQYHLQLQPTLHGIQVFLGNENYDTVLVSVDFAVQYVVNLYLVKVTKSTMIRMRTVKMCDATFARWSRIQFIDYSFTLRCDSGVSRKTSLTTPFRLVYPNATREWLCKNSFRLAINDDYCTLLTGNGFHPL